MQSIALDVKVNVMLLIVPMWNWNIGNIPLQSPRQAFNRTNVELKCVIDLYLSIRLDSFNRTNVELKYGINRYNI